MPQSVASRMNPGKAIVMFQVAEACVGLGLRAGAIVFRGVSVGPASAELRAAIDREAVAVRRRFADPAAIRASTQVRPYHDILRKVGANPRHDQNSVERLLIFARKKSTLPAINSLVDTYNLISLRCGLSLGAHDLDRIAPPVTLRLLTGTEAFLPLGAGEPAPVTPGEFGYVDGDNRLLCRLDVLQADFSKVSEATRNVLLIVEGTERHSPELLYSTVAEVSAAVTRHCGGTAEKTWHCLAHGPPLSLPPRRTE
jgi:DNA/RNA-binding domain of Phe-tRNA-synthetase-like protein